MESKNWKYKKKYGDIGIKIVMILFFIGILAVIIGYPEGLTSSLGGLVAIIFSIFMISIIAIDLIFVKYSEQNMVLSKCEQGPNSVCNCVFFDPVSNKSVRFLMTKPIIFDLVENQVYTVVVARSANKPMIMDVIGVENSEPVINEFKAQSIVQKLSLMEYQEQETKQAEIATNVATTATKVAVVINIIKAIFGILIGGFIIYSGFKSADTTSMISCFIFGGVFVLVCLASIIRKK